MHDRPEPIPEDSSDERQRERWCAGLRRSGVRPLEADEVTRLRGVRRVLGGQIVAFVVALVSILFGVLPIMAGRPLPGRRLAGLALLVCGVPVLGTAAWRLARRRARLGRDLARGEVEQFEGSIGPHERLDRVQRQLIVRGLLHPVVPQMLEVLPSSRRVLNANQSTVARWQEAPVSELASPPSYAFRAPLPPGFGEARGGTDFEFLRRSLNAGELAEIRRSARLLRAPGLAQVAQAACFVVVLALTLLSERAAGWPGGGGLLLGMWIAGVSLAALAYLQRVRVSRALERDTGLGWAITVRPRESDAQAGSADNETPSATEFLPHSLMLWTEGGKPARWRRTVVAR